MKEIIVFTNTQLISAVILWLIGKYCGNFICQAPFWKYIIAMFVLGLTFKLLKMW